MRFVHTSDWHLGRSFHRVGLLDAQAGFVDHLVALVRAERVDAVLVSGDVFDRALPPVEAVALASEAFCRLVDAGAAVVVTSGNHDSAPRLGFGSDLLALAGLHIRTDPVLVDRPALITAHDEQVAVYGIPYLEPDLAAARLGVATRSHQAVLDEAMRRVRADLAGRPNVPSVVLAHAFVAGGRRSESERDISVGGVDAVAVSTFDGVEYVALGHLHGSHVLRDSMRYSGSPLAYSFSEAGQRKGSWLVDIDVRSCAETGPASGRSAANATFIESPVPRPLAVVRGSLETLLSDPVLRAAEGAWVHATVTDSVRPASAHDRLRRRFPEVLVVQFESSHRPPAAVGVRLAAAARSDRELLEGFFVDIAGRAIGRAEWALLEQAFDSVRVAQDAAS